VGQSGVLCGRQWVSPHRSLLIFLSNSDQLVWLGSLDLLEHSKYCFSVANHHNLFSVRFATKADLYRTCRYYGPCVAAACFVQQ